MQKNYKKNTLNEKKQNKFEESNSDQVSNNEIENSARQRVSSARSRGGNQVSSVKLEALNVPNFSGDYKQWSTFNDMFTNENLTESQKFSI